MSLKKEPECNGLDRNASLNIANLCEVFSYFDREQLIELCLISLQLNKLIRRYFPTRSKYFSQNTANPKCSPCLEGIHPYDIFR
uniref:F-box domain-containing protein n=1 Tax=Ditylenchus dipsaci TaxID=166011 RepID=A0A915D6V8_9BILA